MTAGQIAGLAMTFGLCLIPSTLFVGYVAGRVLKWSLNTRILASVIAAAALSYGIVFHGGASPEDACPDTPPYLNNRC